MMKQEKKQKKFKDPYLKPVIQKSLESIEDVINDNKPGEQTIYYSGNFQEDILNNFSQRQSEKIFKKMREFMDNDNLTFVQRKVHMKNVEELELDETKEPISYYEYIVSKRR